MNILSRSLAFVHGIWMTLLLLVCAASSAQTAAPSRDTMKQTLLRQPLHFEPTADGGMSSRSMGRKLRIDDGGSVIFGDHGKDTISVLLDGASAQARPVGQDLLAGQTNFMIGNDQSKWRRGVSQFGRVQVPAVYPGVDLVYYGNGDQLEHDYLLAANADPELIRMKFRGASARLDTATGELVLQRPENSEDALRLQRPVAYQLSKDGKRQSVSASYRLREDGEAQFALGDYDRTRPLVIDPVILYGTYFGGNQTDAISDLKLGSDGSIFLLITGDSTDLKTLGAPAKACNGSCGPANPTHGDVEPDMYIAKLDSTGQTLLFATYLGGSVADQAINLALDTDGSIYIAGGSYSPDFPIVNGYSGPIPSPQGYEAGTLSKLSADGSTLLYSTFIGYGPPQIDLTNPIDASTAPIMVTASNGIVYLIGVATVGPTDASFVWKTNPLFTVGNNFLAKFDTTKSGNASILYATQVGDNLGGFNYAQLTSLALDSKGDVWLYGQTSNTAFPTTTSDALQPQCKSNPCSASFLMEIDPTGTSAPYATYLGGSTAGAAVTPRDILIDPSDDIYVSGNTSQSDFPIVNGAFTTLASINNNGGYASKISSDGKTLLYSTFVQGIEIGVASGGQLAFTGTYGPGLTLKNNLQTTSPSSTATDAIFGLLDTTQSGANSLLISSYLGTNTGYTGSSRILFASTGQLLIAGLTSATDLPVVNAYQQACASCASRTGTDGFIAAIQPNDSLTLTPATLGFPSTSVGSTSAAMTATLYNGTTNSVYLTQPTLTDSTDFTQSNNCNGILSPLASCTITLTFAPKSSGALTSTYTIADLDNTSVSLTIALSGNATAATGKTNTVSPTSLNFGNVAYRTRATLPVTFSNNGTSSITLQPYTVSDSSIFAADFTGTCSNSPVVPAGGSCTYNVIFIPEANQSYSGTFTVVDGITNPVVTLAGVGLAAGGGTGALIISPSPVVAANVAVYQQGSGGYTLTNTTTQTITLLNTTTSGPADLSAGGGGCFAASSAPQVTKTLAPGASCSDSIDYVPQYADEHAQGTLTFTYQVQGSQDTSTASFPIEGNSITDAVVAISPTTIQFPATPAGKTSVQTVTVSNSGQAPLTFNSATLTSGNTKNFSQTNNCGSSVAGNSSCTITVTFAPDTSGSEFTSNLDIQTAVPRPGTNQTDTTDTIVQLNGGTNKADFVVSSNSGTASETPTAAWTIDVSPLTTGIPWNQAVTFTATGLDSFYGTLQFSPTSVTPGDKTQSTTMTLVPPSPSAALREFNPIKKMPILACFLPCLFYLRKRPKNLRLLGLLFIASLTALSLTACSNPPINIVVTATSGAVSHTVTVLFQP